MFDALHAEVRGGQVVHVEIQMEGPPLITQLVSGVMEQEKELVVPVKVIAS